jgi:hypothetical protein
MIFEPDEYTELQDAVRQIYKKDFLTNQQMVAQYNKSLGIKEESKRQFEEKKERDKSIGRVDVLSTPVKKSDFYNEMKRLFKQFEGETDIFVEGDLKSISSTELKDVKNLFIDLINEELNKINIDNNKIQYYKSKVDMIEEYQELNIPIKPIKPTLTRKDQILPRDQILAKNKLELEGSFKKPIKQPIKTLPKPLPITTPIPSTRPKKTRGRPPSKKGAPGDELIIEKINKSEFMKIIPSTYKNMNDLVKLQNYWEEADKVADNILKIEDDDLRRKTEKRYEDRYKAIQFRSDDLEDKELRKGEVESKSEITGNGIKKGKTPTKKKSKQGKTTSNKKSNNKSIGKQEQIYYLLSQRSGNNNKLMNKRLKQNKK